MASGKVSSRTKKNESYSIFKERKRRREETFGGEGQRRKETLKGQSRLDAIRASGLSLPLAARVTPVPLWAQRWGNDT